MGKAQSSSLSTKPKSSNISSYSKPSSSSSSFGKSYTPTTFSKPKTKASFNLLWIPSKRRNTKKEMVWQPNSYERAPTMYPMYSYMSGDTEPFKKKEREVDLLLAERSRAPVTTSATVAMADAASDTRDLEKIDETQEFIKHDKEKDGSGDANEKNSLSSDDYLDNKESNKQSPETKNEKDSGDKVDSVFIKPPIPQKPLAAPAQEDEDCGIKCLYYTLQCCDCVLM